MSSIECRLVKSMPENCGTRGEETLMRGGIAASPRALGLRSSATEDGSARALVASFQTGFKAGCSACALLLACLVVTLTSRSALAAQNEALPPAPAKVQETNAADLLRSNQQLQEQLHEL